MGNILTDIFSDQPAKDAAAAKAAGFAAGNTAATGAIDAGQGLATPLYGQAYAPFGSLINSTATGATAYGNATGVNGQAGIDAAGSTFKSLPGYSGGLTTGIDQVNRTAAARGDLGGGNTSADEIKFASDYDANKYGSYVNSLAPYLGASQSAAAGGAAVLGGQASADQAAAAAKAQYGYNAATGTGNANADAALAPYAASQNFWGALGGAAKLAVAAGTGGASLALPGGMPSFGASAGPMTYGGPSGPTPFS